MGKIVIFGIGDAARMAHYYFTRDSDHEVVAFTADKGYCTGDSFEGAPLVEFGIVTEEYPPSEYMMFVAIGYSRMNQNRAEKYYEARELGYTLPSYVSRHCSYLTDQPIGDNCLIMENTTIQPFVELGNDLILWSGSHINHDSVIEDHCFICSHVVVSGHCRVGSYCFLGANATLRDHITIAPRTLVGAGAVITKDTIEGGVYVPERAKQLDKKSDDVRI